jgi:hypothetical protein
MEHVLNNNNNKDNNNILSLLLAPSSPWPEESLLSNLTNNNEHANNTSSNNILVALPEAFSKRYQAVNMGQVIRAWKRHKMIVEEHSTIKNSTTTFQQELSVDGLLLHGIYPFEKIILGNQTTITTTERKDHWFTSSLLPIRTDKPVTIVSSKQQQQHQRRDRRIILQQHQQRNRHSTTTTTTSSSSSNIDGRSKVHRIVTEVVDSLLQIKHRHTMDSSFQQRYWAVIDATEKIVLAYYSNGPGGLTVKMDDEEVRNLARTQAEPSVNKLFSLTERLCFNNESSDDDSSNSGTPNQNNNSHHQQQQQQQQQQRQQSLPLHTIKSSSRFHHSSITSSASLIITPTISSRDKKSSESSSVNRSSIFITPRT